MGQTHGSGVVPGPYRNARDVVFLGLRDTVFCTVCELISYNNSPQCLACGSAAVLSLSRVLGGSLRGQEMARLLRREEIQSVVGEVLRSTDSFEEEAPATLPLPASRDVRCPEWTHSTLHHGGIPLSALEAGVMRSCELTGASGAAVAISDGKRMICRAREGSTAPDLGVEVPQEGLTALAVRAGLPWRCDDTEQEPWANREACRALRIRSILIAPIIIPRRVLGVLEVFSPAPSAFDDYHSAAVQLVASALAVAIVKGFSGGAKVLPLPEQEFLPSCAETTDGAGVNRIWQ